MAIRWLLAKDLRILRRSPALSVLLVLYPAALAVLIGLALSRGPALPRVAFLNEIPPDQSVITLGTKRIDTRRYERELFQAITPVPVKNRAQAIADVRNGSAIAALIIPADLPRRLASGDQSAEVEVTYNGDAVNQSLVETAIEAKLAQANSLLSVELEKVAGSYIDLLLKGGRLNFLGVAFDVLGLSGSQRVLDAVLKGLPRGSPLRAKLAPVADFARIAVNNLGSSKRVIGAVGAPIVVRQRTISGRRTPLDYYAVAVAVAVSLMFVCLLLSSGMLALEREENTLQRLRRGLVGPAALLGEKALLAAICGVLVGFATLAGIGAFVPLPWARAELWLLALAGGGLAFSMLGVALGGLVRDMRAASLLALLISFPLVFLALVPPGSVAGGLYDVMRVISALFPFKPSFEALDAAVNRTSPGLWEALAHLGALIAGFGVLARLGLRS